MSYTFKPATALRSEQVTQLELELASIKPKRKRKIGRRSYERYGQRNLDAPKRPEYDGNEPYVVRFYYKSMGGEVLCFDSDHMSFRKASNLYNQYHAPYGWDTGTDAIGVLLLRVINGKPERKIHPGCRDARLVILPSQKKDPVEICYDEKIAA